MAPRLTDSGTLVLAGANTWADDMRFDVITGATGLGLGNAAALNGAGLKYNNGGAQLDNTSGADMALTGFKGLILTTGFTFVGTNSLDLSGGNQTGFTQTAGSSRTITVQNNTLTLAGLRAIGNYTMGGGADSVDGSLVKAGNGTLVIAGASEYTLGTTVSAGKLVAGHSNALGTGEMELSNTGATLELANGVNIGNELFFRNTGGAKTLQLSSTATSAAYSGNITLLDTNAGDSRVSVGLGQTLTVTGNIFSSSLTTQGVSKLGDGTLVLSGNDNLGADNAIGGSGANADKKIQGVIAVDAGTLRVNGNMGNATGTINVASGATLGGNGTFAGSVNVDGTLAAGNSIGVLNTGALSMNATSVLDVELGRDTGTPVSDRTNVTGSVSIASGADLELTLYTGLTAPVLGDIFYLISNDGADAISGVFTSLEGTPTTLSEGSTFSWNSLSWTITYLADFEGSAFTGGNDLAIKVIPEPTTLAMLLGGVGMLALLRRRRS
jgi:autotransporter-associated beta strand protein